MTPNFIGRAGDSHCSFYFGFPDGYVYSRSDFFVGNETGKSDWFTDKRETRKAAIERVDGWEVEWVAVDIGRNYVEFNCEANIFASRMAYPIDPSMTEKDINGATIIYPNASNDGWLFAHATKSEHIDRMFIASTAMATLFDNVIEAKLQQTLASIINNPQTNQQRGVYSHWANIVDFKKDCTAYCHKFEKLLYIGQHKHEEGLDLRNILLRCIKHVKAEWQKQNKYDAVSGDVNSIISHLETDHTFETRWEQEARQKREAAARAAAESETENQ